MLETLRDSEGVHSSPHPPRSGPPSPQGEGLNAPESGRGCECRARRFQIPASEALPDRGRTFPFVSAGGAKPIAAMETDAGFLAAAWGGLEGFTPPHH